MVVFVLLISYCGVVDFDTRFRSLLQVVLVKVHRQSPKDYRLREAGLKTNLRQRLEQQVSSMCRLK